MIYYLSLGSNVGNKRLYLQKALKGLAAFGVVLKKSAVYSSDPVGEKDQKIFFNTLVKFDTGLTPFQLMDKIKKLEENIGRTKSYRWGPREIDIDIIEYTGPPIQSENLNIPHVEMENRRFVLLPLMEIENNFKTRDGQTIKQLLSQCNDNGMVEPIKNDW